MPAHDVLARFRGPNYAPPVDAGTASREYVAFKETSTVQRRLWLKRGLTGVDSFPSYAYLTDIQTDNWGLIILTYANPLIVCLHGENLEDLVQAIRNDRADWVEIFDPKKHDRPAEGKPIITGIEAIKNRPEEPEPEKDEMN